MVKHIFKGQQNMDAFWGCFNQGHGLTGGAEESRLASILKTIPYLYVTLSWCCSNQRTVTRARTLGLKFVKDYLSSFIEYDSSTSFNINCGHVMTANTLQGESWKRVWREHS